MNEPIQHAEAAEDAAVGTDRPAPISGGGMPAPPNRSEQLLDEIVGHLRIWQRQQAMEDFTAAKLAGAAVQVLAIGVAFWAFLAMVDPRPDVFPAHRWLAAIFLQLLALTCFHLHHRR